MHFLIEYDPPRGELVTFETFPGSEWEAAAKARLALELDLLHRGVAHEVVILEAESKEALMKSHARYFKTAEELFNELADALGIP